MKEKPLKGIVMTRGSIVVFAAALCLAAGPSFAEAGRTLRSVAPKDGNHLVYEFDGAQDGPKGLTIDTTSILRDVDRTQKRKPNKKTTQPQAATAAQPMIEQTSLRAASVDQPLATPVAAPVSADRKVRVIPLYNVPKN